MYTIAVVENHLTGMGHGSTLNKIQNKYFLYERAANTMRSKIDVITLMRTAPLTNAVHSDVYNYALPSDFSKLIDIYPQANRQSYDIAFRKDATDFDLLKEINQKKISIESENGTRYLRIDWDISGSKTVSGVNSSTNWSAVGSAANITEDSLFKISGSKSLRFDVVATGDGLKNTALDALDLSDWDEQATFFAWLYIPDTSNITSVAARWGNDVSTAYWESTAVTTQADGTAFKVGWNLLKFDWDSATETGTVDPETIDSFQIAITGSAQANYRLDNIIVSLGSIFEMKYLSQYAFQDSSGTWIQRPTSDTDVIVVDDLAFNIFLHECLIAMAQQQEGEDSGFDVQFAQVELNGNPRSPDPTQRMGAYRRYKREYPSQTKKQTQTWFSSRRATGKHWIW